MVTWFTIEGIFLDSIWPVHLVMNRKFVASVFCTPMVVRTYGNNHSSSRRHCFLHNIFPGPNLKYSGFPLNENILENRRQFVAFIFDIPLVVRIQGNIKQQ